MTGRQTKHVTCPLCDDHRWHAAHQKYSQLTVQMARNRGNLSSIPTYIHKYKQPTHRAKYYIPTLVESSVTMPATPLLVLPLLQYSCSQAQHQHVLCGTPRSHSAFCPRCKCKHNDCASNVPMQHRWLQAQPVGVPHGITPTYEPGSAAIPCTRVITQQYPSLATNPKPLSANSPQCTTLHSSSMPSNTT
jgi:hypothetical protein